MRQCTDRRFCRNLSYQIKPNPFKDGDGKPRVLASFATPSTTPQRTPRPPGRRIHETFRGRGSGINIGLNVRWFNGGAIVGLAMVLVVFPAVLNGQEPDQQPAPELQQVEELVVIGSHVATSDLDGLLPVLVMDRQAIERSGVNTVAETMQQLPMGNAGSFSDRDSLSSALGGSAVSFRGLGANAVLVLVNGRRVANYGFAYRSDTLVTFVDLNSIPLAAVERIEILKDGASALYGSDAMAGVINIVLRENISGVELQARVGVADDEGAEERTFNALFGWVGKRTSAELLTTYTQREQLLWRDRDIGKTADHREQGGLDLRSTAAVNGVFGGLMGTGGAECEQRGGSVPGIQDFEELDESDFGGPCLYNPNTETADPSTERIGLMGILNHAFRPDLGLHVEASYSNAQVERQLASSAFVGAFNDLEANPWIPPLSPEQEGLEGTLFYRFLETGPRIDSVETDNFRGVITLAGGLNRWDWELGALYNHAASSNEGEGYLSAAKVQEALHGTDLNDDGVLQPEEFWNTYTSASNPNSRELADTLLVTTFRESTTEAYSFDGQMSGPIFELPAGDVALAVGFERRHESLRDGSDPQSLAALNSANSALFGSFALRIDRPSDEIDSFEELICLILCSESGGAFAPGSFDLTAHFVDTSGSETAGGSRDHTSIYGELYVPLLENLQMQLALRYENYSDFGSDINPRIALGYQAIPRLQFRGSWGTGFRAPSLAELYLGPAATLQMVWDPKRCPEWFFNEVANACLVRAFPTVTGGNPDLRPEESESWTLGFTAEPLDNFTVAVDYWRIEITDRIIAPGVAFILRNEDELGSDFVVRDPPNAFDSEVGIAGFINQVNNSYLNLGTQEVAGYDLEIDYGVATNRFGYFGVQLLGTHLASNKFALGSDENLKELAGTYGYPENRANLNTFWSNDNWLFGVYGRWIDGFEDTNREDDVDSHVEWDTNVSYSGINHLKLTLGVENMFDAEPPFAVGDFNLQGFPAQFYNMRGRFYYAQMTLSL